MYVSLSLLPSCHLGQFANLLTRCACSSSMTKHTKGGRMSGDRVSTDRQVVKTLTSTYGVINLWCYQPDGDLPDYSVAEDYGTLCVISITLST